MKNLSDLVVLIRGSGKLASGVAHRRYASHFRLCLTDIVQPQAVRREVSFCEAVYDGEKTVEGVTAMLVSSFGQIGEVWDKGRISLIVDPEAGAKDSLKPDVLVRRHIGQEEPWHPMNTTSSLVLFILKRLRKRKRRRMDILRVTEAKGLV